MMDGVLRWPFTPIQKKYDVFMFFNVSFLIFLDHSEFQMTNEAHKKADQTVTKKKLFYRLKLKRGG